MNIYIYKDLGVAEESLRQTVYTFNECCATGYNIQVISAKEIRYSNWTENAALLVMPGGADVPYHRKLQGLGNLRIKEYIQQGGRYLGICAGAYYACDSIEFDVGGQWETIASRELKFFSGMAIGPVFNCYSYYDNSAAIVARVSVDGVGTVRAFFNGGCYFKMDKECEGIKIIGRYTENDLPAIIGTHNNRVILSSIHFEYDPIIFTKPDIMHLKDELTSYQERRKELLRYILDLLKVQHV